MKKTLIVAFIVGGLHCTPPSPLHNTASNSKIRTTKAFTPEMVCRDEVLGLDDFLHDTQILMIGELHGTEQIPRAVGDILCHSAKRGPVILAVEKVERAPFADFIKKTDSKEAWDSLFVSDPWSGVDGRDSKSYLDLFKQARELSKHGYDVTLRGFMPLESTENH